MRKASSLVCIIAGLLSTGCTRPSRKPVLPPLGDPGALYDETLRNVHYATGEDISVGGEFETSVKNEQRQQLYDMIRRRCETSYFLHKK